MGEDMEKAIEDLRQAYAAFNRGEFDATVDFMHPEIEFARVADVEQPLRGREAVRGFMTPDVFETQHLEIHSIEDVGDCILVDGTFTGKGAGSGMEISQRGYHLWRVKDGKAISFRYFLDRDDALAAARG